MSHSKRPTCACNLLQYTGVGTKERLLFVNNKGASFICYQQGDVFYLFSTKRSLLFFYQKGVVFFFNISKGMSIICYEQGEVIYFLSTSKSFIYI